MNIQLLFESGWRFWDYRANHQNKFFLICPIDQLSSLPIGTQLYSLLSREKKLFIVGKDELSEDAFMGLSIYGIFVDPWIPTRKKVKLEGKTDLNLEKSLKIA